MLGTYRVDRETLQVQLRRLGALKDGITAGSIDAMENALEGVYKIAQGYIPRGSGPGAGKLAKSMDRYIHDLRPGQGVIAGKVTMMNRQDGQLPYAFQREYGGTIYPRPENPIGRLVWTDQDTGEVIFARRVTQAGSHYMEGAAIEGHDVVLESFRGMMDEVISLRRS